MSTLRLVRADDQGPRSPRGRRRTADPLTDDERRHVKQALRTLSLHHGGMDVVASLTGARVATLYTAVSKRGRPTAALALLRFVGLAQNTHSDQRGRFGFLREPRTTRGGMGTGLRSHVDRRWMTIGIPAIT